MNEFDPLEFGRVLGRLDSQDKQLFRLEKEVRELNAKIDTLIQQGADAKTSRLGKPDWLELIVGAVLGAVAYFIGAKFAGG